MALILGIESSCDETAAAVESRAGEELSSVVATQVETHGKNGGVEPELASREPLRSIVPVGGGGVEEAGVGWKELSAVAVTSGPGLVGSLLVGLTYAKALSMVRGLPLIGVNHIEGHIHAVVLEARRSGGEIELPALALVASGGHTHLFEFAEAGKYRLMGKTRDDAAGEAFDKVAKLLGFGYPGGPVLDMLAPHGEADAVRLPMSKMKGNALDFSFSGLKTAMLRWTQGRAMEGEIVARRALQKLHARPTLEQWLAVTPQETLDAVAAFQQVVVEELLKRVEKAVEETGARSVIVAGGVACNAGLRSAARSGRVACPVYFPTVHLSTDNAAMIAAAAWPKYERGEFDDLTLKAQANLSLA
ncbi:MAG: tRNA (adenosine(37)-N6)-threonylcarbamoyltransferase complex transferase subunit TsaD [Acidobacteria bacterium]|nr:tRNA (adenosine(37)-N6)-threonylcarbamoyltransferase complex transferase subunit TsaD [Acidobacteriota bacterium]